MIDRAVVGVAVAVLLTVMAVALLLIILPLFQRIAFDLVCQDYVRRMDAGGGLNDGQIAMLAEELVNLGFTVEHLAASRSMPFGSDLTLSVQATRPRRRITAELTMEEAVLSFAFTRTVVCRKIITAAGDP